MGAVAVTNVRHLGQQSGVRGRVVAADITMSSSYATGGDTLAIASLNLVRLEGMAVVSGIGNFQVKGAAPAARVGGVGLELGGTSVAPKILAFAAVDGTDTEVGNAVNISEVTGTVFFYGF